MRFTFFCQNKIDAFYMAGTKHAVIASGIFSTTDEDLAKFLHGYPGVKWLSNEAEKPAAPNPGQHGPVPEQPPVINGGLTAGGMSGVRIKRQ